jgi:hypothetical protein
VVREHDVSRLSLFVDASNLFHIYRFEVLRTVFALFLLLLGSCICPRGGAKRGPRSGRTRSICEVQKEAI